MFINPRNYKPCFECKGIGKRSAVVCKACGGYGSIGLKVVMTNLRKTNEGEVDVSKAEFKAYGRPENA